MEIQNQNSQPNLPTEQPKPANVWFDKKHIIAYIIALVGLGVIGGSIYSYWKYNDRLNNNDNCIPYKAIKICNPAPALFNSGNQSENFSNWKTYVNSQYGFEFLYPKNWQTPAQVLAGNPDYEKSNIATVQDPNRAPSDVGGSLDPIFIVRLYNSVAEIPPIAKYLQAQSDEIKTTTKSVMVDGQNVQETDYESFAAEGAYDITYQVRLNKNNKIFILQFSYTLAGCSQIPQDSRPQCEIENDALKNKGNVVWSQFLTTFKFTNSSIPNPKTYRNDEFGFSLVYDSTQDKPRVVTDSYSVPVYYDPVADFDFALYFYHNTDKYRGVSVNTYEDQDENLSYSSAKQQWIISSNSIKPACPEEQFTKNQNVPYYQIGTGRHAGAFVRAYITQKGIVVLAGGQYHGDDGYFHDDEITFDNPKSVLKATCLAVKPN